MREEISKAAVTGAAGFIGSHVAERLVEQGVDVIGIDNLSEGILGNLRSIEDKNEFSFVSADLKSDSLGFVEGCDAIFHVAGNPDVRTEGNESHFNDNVLATYRLLEAARKFGVKAFVFTSSSTVYGEATRVPTPEDYAPLRPISVYGGSKLANEAMISAYAHRYSIRSIAYRFANVVGERSKHGVVRDFVTKLSKDPKRLEILGSGRQFKSYICIEDCVSGMLHPLHPRYEDVSLFDVYNLGSLDAIDVLTVAKVVAKEMDLVPRLEVNGGVDGGRGWRGDVRHMHLDITKIMSLGWRPSLTSSDSVAKATRELMRTRLEEALQEMVK